jgi:hypothetical protein
MANVGFTTGRFTKDPKPLAHVFAPIKFHATAYIQPRTSSEMH